MYFLFTFVWCSPHFFEKCFALKCYTMCSARLAAIAFHLQYVFLKTKKAPPKPNKIDNLRGRTVIEQQKK